MKTILPIFAVIFWLGILATPVNAGPAALPDSESNKPGTKTTTIQQPRKQLQQPPAKQQTSTRTAARPVLKRTESFRPLPNDDRKKIDDSMDP